MSASFALTSPSTALRQMLLVDDSTLFRRRLARALTDRGYAVWEAEDCEDALNVAREQTIDLAVVDLRMPGRSGLELLCELKQLQPEIRVVMLTGFGSIATAVEAMRLGATNYVAKPVHADEILAAFGDHATCLNVAPDEFEVPSLAQAEWEHIQRVLSDCDGNISEAARRLGIHRRSLQRKLKKRPQ